MWTLFLPSFIQHGAKDFGDVLDTEIKSDYPDEETQPTSQTVDEAEQDSDSFKLLEQTIIRHNQQAYAGQIVGLLKGSFVCGFKDEDKLWRIIEVKRDAAVYAEEIEVENVQLSRLF